MLRLTLRIILDIAIFLCLVQAWWYFALPLAIIGIWSFGFYIEIILAGLIYDALFGSTDVRELSSSIGLIVGVIMFIVLTIFKRMVRIRK